MILLSVGTQLHFDRLVRAVDGYLDNHSHIHVIAQVARSEYQPRNMRSQSFFDPAEYQRHFEAAQFIVGHAGMGTIIQSLLHGKPILIMPRQAALGEQRNDHQLATAQHFSQRAGILVAQDEHEVPQRMDELLSLQTSQAIGKYASAELLEYVRKFVNGG